MVYNPGATPVLARGITTALEAVYRIHTGTEAGRIMDCCTGRLDGVINEIRRALYPVERILPSIASMA